MAGDVIYDLGIDELIASEHIQSRSFCRALDPFADAQVYPVSFVFFCPFHCFELTALVRSQVTKPKALFSTSFIRRTLFFTFSARFAHFAADAFPEEADTFSFVRFRFAEGADFGGHFAQELFVVAFQVDHGVRALVLACFHFNFLREHEDNRVGVANEVSGKVKPHNDENGTVIGLCGECSITVKGANPVEEKRKTITFQINSRDVAIPVTTPGTEVLAPPNAPEGTKPDLSGPFIEGTKIRPSKQSSYYVEILARTTGSTEYTVLTPVMRDSYPHVSIKHGSALAVRAGNDTNYEAAIELRLDGLPRFALANDANVRNQNHFDLVSPGSFRDLKGFFLTNQEIAEFTVGNYSNSAAAQVFPDGSDAGTLAISFHAAWEKGKPSPPNEPHRPAKGEKPGIVPGEVRKDPIQIVPRQVGRLRAAVRVLYDNEG